MGKLDAFRKLIREEVRHVIREELKTFLKEAQTPSNAGSYKSSLKEIAKPKVQQAPRPLANYRPSSDPIQDLLAETAGAMTGDEYRTMINADTGMAQGFPQMVQSHRAFAVPDEYEQPQVVESVADMIATTGPVNDINQVTIDAVPDFSALMQTLKNKGQI